LFDADKGTRIENDRNLFYEEMILRFGIQRRHPVGDDIKEIFDTRLQRASDGEEDLEDLFDWMAETVYVTFEIFGRDSEEVEAWRAIAEASARPGAADRLLDVLPSRRWRLLSEFSDGPIDLFESQLNREYVRNYVTELIKTCYFVLRAVGDTGLEPYLDVFFDWVDEDFGIDGTKMMPRIYNETTANDRLIDEIFEDLYEEKFAEQVEEARQSWGREDIEAALDNVLEDVGGTDLSDIPPGHYDFGRFVLDELFGMEYHAPDFAYKLHRLT